MNTLFVGKVFHRLSAIGSTNDWLGDRIGEDLPEGTVVQAEHQTAGKGQSGNHWRADPGLNLTFSIFLKPTFIGPNEVFYLNKVVSCALHKVLQTLLPTEEVHIKWPNDLLINRRKVAGMLTENQFAGTKLKTSIIGVGLNVNQHDFPEADYGRATSLSLEAGRPMDREEVLHAVLEAIEAEYFGLKAGRREALDRNYLQHLWAYQEVTDLKIEGKEQQAIVTGVDPFGRLAVQIGNGLRYFQVKEVEFLFNSSKGRY